MRYKLLTFCMAGFLMLSWSGPAAHSQPAEDSARGGQEYSLPQEKMPAGFKLLAAGQGDVTGDGRPDKVYLTGKETAGSQLYSSDFRLLVEDGADQSWTEVELGDMGGYEAGLFLGDFTGDKIDDCLITAASGGSGGWYANRVVTFYGGDPRIIFNEQDNRGSMVEGRFIDGYKVEFWNHENIPVVTMDVSSRKADYLRLGLYDETGRLNTAAGTMATPFGKLEPVAVNQAGLFELKGLQRISGAYNADGLAIVETTLYYTGSAWQARSITLRLDLPAGNKNITREVVQ